MIFSILVALSLNFDTFSIAVIQGAQAKKPSIKTAVLIACGFTLGHISMTLIGAFLGNGFKLLIDSVDHWIAFFLLSFVGFRMIIDSSKVGADRCEKISEAINVKKFILLIFATSIDTLIIGISFVFMKTPIMQNTIIIGVVTLILSFCGAYAGKQLKEICKNNLSVIGGTILFLLGCKTLIQHLFV